MIAVLGRSGRRSGYSGGMLRIISGEFRRRLLKTPPDAEKTRPIPDRVKESLFQILRGHCEGAAVFEGFSGVGAIGLEAMSRGAKRVVMVERDREIFRLLEQNIETLGCHDRVEPICGDALGPGALARCPRPVHLVFFDPPYAMVRDPAGWGRVKGQFERLIAMLDDTGYAVLRTPWPLFHEFGPDGQPVSQVEEVSRGKKPAKADRKLDHDAKTDQRWLSADEIAEEFDKAVAGVEEDEEPGEAPAAPAEPVVEPENRREFIDLKMAGAVGPETHVYHAMAVHLYMRAKA